MEMAAASGLELLRDHERDALRASTFGTGQLIRHALDRGCRKILLGIGGSATTDGGTGMARALGVRFLDEAGREVEEGGGALGAIRRVDTDGLDPRIGETEIRVACDVDNPLTGPRGAAAVYGPQKGAGPEEVSLLDNNLEHLARILKSQWGRDVEHLPGGGAAGGLGAGLVAFLDARLEKGFGLVAETLELENAIRWAAVVITGEGKLDLQSRHGKVPWGIAQLARKHGKPVIVVAGSLEEGVELAMADLFDRFLEIRDRTREIGWSMEHAAMLLEQAGQMLAPEISNFGR
jgi:glycerate kinase